MLQVKPVHGSFLDAASESIREWIENLETGYYLSGMAVGPQTIPSMVREFNSAIGKETRKRAMEKWGGMPDVLVGCVLIGVEGCRLIINSADLHSANLK